METVKTVPLNQIVMVWEDQLIGNRWVEGYKLSSGNMNQWSGFAQFVDIGSKERAAKLEQKGVVLVVANAADWQQEYDEMIEDDQDYSDIGMGLRDFLAVVKGEAQPPMTHSLEFVDCPLTGGYGRPDPVQLKQLREQIWGGIPVEIEVNDIKLTVVVNGNASEPMTIPVDAEPVKAKKRRKATK